MEQHDTYFLYKDRGRKLGHTRTARPVFPGTWHRCRCAARGGSAVVAGPKPVPGERRSSGRSASGGSRLASAAWSPKTAAASTNAALAGR